MRLSLILSAILAFSCVAAHAQQSPPAQPQQGPTPEMRAAGKMVADAGDREFSALTNLVRAQDEIYRLSNQLKVAEAKLASAEKAQAPASTEPPPASPDRKDQ